MFGWLFGSTSSNSKKASNPPKIPKGRNNAKISLNNHAIDIKIIERYATISYLFDFENINDYGSKELTFEITISPNAFISGFTADIDGDLFIGETKEKKVAKKEYTAAKQKDENAVLISQIDKLIPNLFKIQTNIDAESQISLKITIEQYLKKQFNFTELNVEVLRYFDKYDIVRLDQHIAFNLNITDKRGIYDIKLPSMFGETEATNPKDKPSMNKSNTCYAIKGKLMYQQNEMTEFTVKYKIKGEQNESSILYDPKSKTFCHIISDIITDSLINDMDLCEGHNDEIKANVLIPRRVVFLIDRSYSMHGDKWNKTKTATITALNLLRLNYDRYCVIFFDQNMKQFPPQNRVMLLADNENIQNAITYVQNMGLGGATDINVPLLRSIELIKNDIRLLNGEDLINNKYTNNDEEDELIALQRMMDDYEYYDDTVVPESATQEKNNTLLPQTDKKNVDYLADNYNFYMNQIILISDGEPNNGVTDTNAILSNVSNANKLDGIDKYSQKISIFSFGVGSNRNDAVWTKDLNHSFLKLLSLNNNGMYERVKQINCETRLNEYYHVLSKPILTNIDIKYNTKNIKNITNTKFSTLFHGTDLIICGQLIDDKQLNIDVTISAITGKEVKENNKFITKPIHINKEITINIAQNNEYKESEYENNIERMWAYFKLQQFSKQKLMYNDMIAMDENEQKQDDALPLQLAMKYKFVTPWTSMIVVKQREAKKKPKIVDEDIQKLHEALQLFERREAHLEKRINVCSNKAKTKSKRRDKKGALFELKKKKQFEKQLSLMQAQKFDIERQIMVSEDDNHNNGSYGTLKPMKTEELMEDINESNSMQMEMNDVMSQPLGDLDMSDDDLEAELAELEDTEADELLNEMPVHAYYASNCSQLQDDGMICEFGVPSVPQKRINTVDEDNELAELEAMMNGSTDQDGKRQDLVSRFVVESEEKKEVNKTIEAYNDKEIRITFEIIKPSKDSDICRVLATFYNKTSGDMDNFSFIVEVPEYINLQMQAANGTKLLKESKNTISQEFELDNTKYGDKPFVVNMKITFIQNSKQCEIFTTVQISV